jgi:glycosyltransferase involved in cell wall biosynthesis
LTTQARPLVTLGVPVRNGARTLAMALDSLRRQTYENLEILLSDNESSDETANIMRAFATEDLRATYVRHDDALKVLDHFSKVIQAARGKYIVLCAADDERNDAYVETLVDALERDPKAVLAFGRVVAVSEDGRRRDLPFEFENSSLPIWRRIARSAWTHCTHFYGMWRTSVLRSIQIRETTYWPDMQVMMAANCLGTFIRDDRAIFIGHEHHKSNAERARYQSYTTNGPLYRGGMFATSAAGILDAGGGLPMALWATSLLAMREAHSAAAKVGRYLKRESYDAKIP